MKKNIMTYKKSTILITAFIAIAGCSTTERTWVRDDVPRSEADQALADCKYQAKAATITIGSNNHPKTWTKAIGTGIGDGIVQAMDEAELVKSCMNSKGFR